jgi:hypothetical protein
MNVAYLVELHRVLYHRVMRQVTVRFGEKTGSALIDPDADLLLPEQPGKGKENILVEFVS